MQHQPTLNVLFAESDVKQTSLNSVVLGVQHHAVQIIHHVAKVCNSDPKIVTVTAPNVAVRRMWRHGESLEESKESEALKTACPSCEKQVPSSACGRPSEKEHRAATVIQTQKL